MNNEELNLENVNEIDMECSIADDDDSFEVFDSKSMNDDSEFADVRKPTKTGIILNFEDEDDVPTKVIAAEKLNVPENINITQENFDIQSSDLNEIDMETYTCEDDDDDFENKELVDEDLLKMDEKSTKITTGEVEDDYWKKMSKKHADSNKKGSYNTSFHISGNPEKEAKIFNHMMGSDGGTTSGISDIFASTASLQSEINSLANQGIESSDLTSGEFSASEEFGGDFGGEGCSEKVENEIKIDYSKKLNEIFDIIGFEVIKNSDGSLSALDNCDPGNDLKCPNIENLIIELKPYIEDCFIIPLQIESGEKFDNYIDWVNWYSEDNIKKYPNLKSDIDYCDLLANHLKDCEIY